MKYAVTNTITAIQINKVNRNTQTNTKHKQASQTKTNILINQNKTQNKPTNQSNQTNQPQAIKTHQPKQVIINKPK